MKKNLLVIFSLLLVIVNFTGCGVTPMFNVKVDSIGNQNGKNKYILLSGMKDVNDNNLQFKEFAKYLDNALQQKGFIKTNYENADIAIFLLYGISEPKLDIQKQVYKATVSGWEAVGYGLAGGGKNQGELFTRYFNINAIDINSYKNSNKQIQVWETTVTSTGSSGDLRSVFPILVAASKDYIGTNTGKQLEVHLSEDDQKVLDIKNSIK